MVFTVKCLYEFIATMIMILLGDGVCAGNTLKFSKGQNGGWVVITLAWGFAVMCGVFIAGPVSGAHLNPAVTLGLALSGSFAWSAVLPYVAAQMLGGFAGACLVWLFYKDHFDATADQPDAMLGCFCTAPAIRHTSLNFLSEFVATGLLVFLILALGTKGNAAAAGSIPVGMGSLGAFPVTCVIMALGMSLGATTGYAMNPARDLSPRLAHAVLPIRGKRDSDWGYSWVPVLGPVCGGAAAAGLFLLLF